MERTLSIIKPDGVKRNLIGKIVARFEEEGLRVAAAKLIHMDERVAGGFYHVHRARPFFGELVEFMVSGPCLVMVLEGQNAIAKNREIMGATNPKDAAPGTIRQMYAESIEANTVHGSDAPETAAFEIGYFFPGKEVFDAAE